MRIVHITTGLGNGGAERTLYKLACEDLQNSHSVISLTAGGYYAKKLDQQGVPVVELQMEKTIISVFLGVLQLRYFLAQEKPEIVQTWMYHSDFLGGLVARFSGIRNVVWNVRESRPKLKNSSLTIWALTRFLALLSHAVPKRIVYCAATAQNDHEALGYNETKGVLIQNGYDPNAWKRSPEAREKVRAALGVGSTSVLIGLIARFHPRKNHVGFMKACQELLNLGLQFQVLLIGQGISERNLILSESIRVTNMKDHVSIMGEVSNISEIMSAIDILVLPSLEGEGFPNVVAETMLNETPCVVSSSGDSSHIVARNGWVFPVGSQSHLVDSLRIAITTPLPHRRSMGKKARASIVRTFSQEKMLQKYQNLYLSVTQDARRRVR